MGLFSRGNGGKLSEELVLQALATVQEPELGGDLVARRMVKDLKIAGERVSFTVELTTPACPLKDQIKDECEAALERAFQPPIRPPGPGRYYYIAVMNVETLSMSDLEELRRWLRGEARPAVTGGKPVGQAVETGLRRFFVRLLGIPTRRYDVRTDVFEVR